MSGIGFGESKTILTIVFEQIAKKVGVDYIKIRDELLKIAGKNKYEVKLNNVLGFKNPTNTAGGAATFLATYFSSDMAVRRTMFAAVTFNPSDEYVLRFAKTSTHCIVAIGVYPATDLFHLTVPRNPSPPGFIPYAVHFTEEASKYREYYAFDDMTTLLKRDKMAPLVAGVRIRKSRKANIKPKHNRLLVTRRKKSKF
jgi:hypothetical protein